VNTFLQVADYYLVAHGLTVVTDEVPSPSTKKVKIPNACLGIGVKWMSPYEMLRVERAYLAGRKDGLRAGGVGRIAIART
jgi:hypothetical protein